MALQLPLAGYRTGFNSNILNNGSAGSYWSAIKFDSGNAISLELSSNNVFTYTGHRTNGLSVRCFKNSDTIYACT